MSDDTKGVILAGGRGTRLQPITHTGPKQLIPVGNKPVLQHAIDDMRAAGITEIGIILGNKGRDEIQEYFGDGSEFGVDITYIVQGNPIGIAHAVGCARDFVGDDDFVVFLGDNIFERGIGKFVDNFRVGDHAASIALMEVDRPEEFGIAEVSPDQSIEQIVEKPDDPPSNLAVVGVYAFSTRIFDVIDDLEPSARGELEITDALQGLLDEGASITYDVVDGWWKDTGYPTDILETNRLVLEGRKSGGVTDGGGEAADTIEIADSADVDPDARIRGPAAIGENVTIGPDADVGPYVSVGAGSEIERGHVRNSVLMREVTIDTDGEIEASLIGQNAEIQTDEKRGTDRRAFVIGEDSTVSL